MCRSDENAGKNMTSGAAAPNAATAQGFHGNYVACAGSTLFGNNSANPTTPTGDQLDGMFYCFSKTKIADLLDGTSNTAAFSEILVSQDISGHDLRGRYHNTWQGNSLFSALYPPNTTVGDRSSYCQAIARRPAKRWAPPG